MLLLTLHLPERIVTTATTTIPDNISQFRDDCHEGGVILCSCHHGAWELLPTALSPHIPAHARKQGCVVYSTTAQHGTRRSPAGLTHGSSAHEYDS